MEAALKPTGKMVSMSARRCDRLLQPTAPLERERNQLAIHPLSDMLRARVQPVSMGMFVISQMCPVVAVACSSIHQDQMLLESKTSTLGGVTSTRTSSDLHPAADDECS